VKSSAKAGSRRRHTQKKRTIVWQKQAGWLVKTIVSLHESPAAHGQKWTWGMISHYITSYRKLRANTPLSCEPVGCDYDGKINAIIEYYKDCQ